MLVIGNAQFIPIEFSCVIKKYTRIFNKALKLSKAALGDTSPGKMVNLLSNDVARFDSVLLFSHQLWTGPVSALIVVALLYRDCGFSGLIGAGVVFAIMPIQSISGKLAGKYRSQTAAKTDERVRLMDEIIGGIQVIKMYAWEKPFAKIIEAARKAELDIILKGCYLNAPFMILNLMTTKLALFITLLCMALTGQEITVAKGFVLATYLNTISVAVVALFARCVSSIAEARVAIKRIREFLLTEEHEPVKSLPMILNGIEKPTSDLEKRVALKEVTAKWSEKGDRTALKNLNMDVSNGALVGVVGAVGSGKSSLLQTILGELVIAEGSMTINGKISYASQDSWIFAATVRQNIVFCQEYEEKRYNEVVRVCALEQDFKDFENGDVTLVGDRGASLSGGQKARINLARAIYQEADIYLLDDPLSAVDTRVSQHLYEECIKSYLANKTIILVTHQVHYLQDADHIIILNNGSVEAEGSFNSLTTENNSYVKQIINEPKENEEVEKVGNESSSGLVWALIVYQSEKTASIDNNEDDTSSEKSVDSEAEGVTETEKEREHLLKEKHLNEDSSKGIVEGSIFIRYFLSGGSYCYLFLVLISCLLTPFWASGLDYYFSYWLTMEEFRNITNVNETVEQD
ncbi:hypothetical protein JTB14_023947 [Gonioctena quinquepunctata]|nr:hypothetical protein JTB14_023947 [Gonioctena quinquepunctata]